MNNDHINTIGRIAAKSLINQRPKHTKAKGKVKHPGGIYSLVASASQRENDARIGVIDDFVKAARAQSRGARTSALREFIVDAIHSAIIKRASEVEARRHALDELKRQHAHLIEERELREVGDYPRTEDETA